MNKGKMWAGLLVVFVLGGVIGALSDRIYYQHKVISRLERIRMDKGPFMAELMITRLAETLELSEEQKQKVQSLIEENFNRIHEVFTETHPRLEKISQETVARLNGVLTPDQQKKLVEKFGNWPFMRPPPPPPPFRKGGPRGPEGGPDRPDGPPPFGPRPDK
ncbi:MAG: hypothetical protein KKB20_00290 [Proteobacteria bacterium]|nr:hypothetical protein [Pseudomonadota bacterium]